MVINLRLDDSAWSNGIIFWACWANTTSFADLMIEHNLGVSTYQSFALKRLDKNFFTKD
jgi:hypothetical protein